MPKAPNRVLARIADALGEPEEAAEEYAAYLQRAPRSADDRKWVEQRLAALKGAPRP